MHSGRLVALVEMAALAAKLLWDIGFRRIVAGSVAKTLLTKCFEHLGVLLAQPVKEPESNCQKPLPLPSQAITKFLFI